MSFQEDAIHSWIQDTLSKNRQKVAQVASTSTASGGKGDRGRVNSTIDSSSFIFQQSSSTTSATPYTQLNEGESLISLDIPWSTYVELFNEVDSDWWIWLIVGIIALAIVGLCITIICWCALARPRGGLAAAANTNINNQSSTEQVQSNVVKRVFFHGRPNSSRMSLSTISTPSELMTPIPRKRASPPPPQFRPEPRQPPPRQQVVPARAPPPQPIGLPIPPYEREPLDGAPALPNVHREIAQSFVSNRPGYYERGYAGQERF